MDGKQVKRQAADMLLDIGIKIPITPPRLFARRWLRPRLIMHRPPLGALMRIARKYQQAGIDVGELETMDYGAQMKLVAEKGKLISEMVALSICTGFLSGLIFTKPLAWYMRWKVHPVMLSQAMMQLLKGAKADPFCTTILLAAQVEKLLEPIGSQTKGMS